MRGKFAFVVVGGWHEVGHYQRTAFDRYAVENEILSTVRFSFYIELRCQHLILEVYIQPIKYLYIELRFNLGQAIVVIKRQFDSIEGTSCLLWCQH